MLESRQATRSRLKNVAGDPREEKQTKRTRRKSKKCEAVQTGTRIWRSKDVLDEGGRYVMPAKKQEMRTSEPETIIMFHTVTAWRVDKVAIEGHFIDLKREKKHVRSNCSCNVWVVMTRMQKSGLKLFSVSYLVSKLLTHTTF